MRLLWQNELEEFYMKYVVVYNEYSIGPVWCYGEDSHLNLDLFDVIRNDEETMSLIYEIDDLYSSYFDFDSLEKFNKKKQIETKGQMLSLITRLVKRLNEINDGSYVVEDLETKKLMSL